MVQSDDFVFCRGRRHALQIVKMAFHSEYI